jgi:hypothetical protein
MRVEKAIAGTHASQRVTVNPKTTPSQPKLHDLPIAVEHWRCPCQNGLVDGEESQLGCVLILWTPQE